MPITTDSVTLEELDTDIGDQRCRLIWDFGFSLQVPGLRHRHFGRKYLCGRPAKHVVLVRCPNHGSDHLPLCGRCFRLGRLLRWALRCSRCNKPGRWIA